MMDYESIKRDCFWDLNISNDDIDEIITGSNFRDKAFLFEKILLNSTNLLRDLKIFKTEDLMPLVEAFKVPKFNYDYIFRRKNIVEVFFFGRPLRIDELKWLA